MDASWDRQVEGRKNDLQNERKEAASSQTAGVWLMQIVGVRLMRKAEGGRVVFACLREWPAARRILNAQARA